jgi:hypothetical protein
MWLTGVEPNTANIKGNYASYQNSASLKNKKILKIKTDFLVTKLS